MQVDDLRDALYAVYISCSFILTTCADSSCDLRGENGPMSLAWGGVATYVALEAWRWQCQSVFISVESQWQVVGAWEQVSYSPPLHSCHSAAPICPQKFTSGCYSSKNGVCSQFSCRQDWGAPGRKQKHRWRWAEEAMLHLREESFILCVMRVALSAHKIWCKL